MYPTAIIDVYIRKILTWGISNTMDAEWCKQVRADAVNRFGKPEIVNSDQGNQYTSIQWTQYIENEVHIAISMGSNGRALDNRCIERFWKILKYEYVYLHPAEDGFEPYGGAQNHFGYDNQKKHQT